MINWYCLHLALSKFDFISCKYDCDYVSTAVVPPTNKNPNNQPINNPPSKKTAKKQSKQTKNQSDLKHHNLKTALQNRVYLIGYGGDRGFMRESRIDNITRDNGRGKLALGEWYSTKEFYLCNILSLTALYIIVPKILNSPYQICC